MTEYSLHPDPASSPPPFYPCAKEKMVRFYGATPRASATPQGQRSERRIRG